MIDQKANPVAWALLGYELSDAQEHLAQLLQEMQEQPDFSEVEYRIWLAHIYAHLNRAWNRRFLADAAVEAENSQVNLLESQRTWDSQSQFPTDIEPL